GEVVGGEGDEGAAGMGAEIGDEVWVCHAATRRELKIPSIDSAVATIPAAVSLPRFAISTIRWTPSARWSAVVRAVLSKCRIGIAVRRFTCPIRPSNIGNRSGSGCWTLAKSSDA